MTWEHYLLIAVPCGLVTSLDIGLSNVSMVTLTITFYTMVKASTPIFVLAWAYVFGIERITWSLIGVVLIIAFGEFLTVLGEVEFKPMGFVLCLSAAVMSGARWTLVQKNLKSLEPPLKTTIATMKLLAPCMFVSMLAFSLAIEQPWTKVDTHDPFQAMIRILGLGIIGAIFAICMILCEFHLIMHSTAIVLMIGGVVKELITIIMGVVAFHDPLNRINALGCVIVLFGVVVYKVTHHWNNDQGFPADPSHAKPKARQYREVGSMDPEDDDDFHNDNDDFDAVHERRASSASSDNNTHNSPGMELRSVELRRSSSSNNSNGNSSSANGNNNNNNNNNGKLQSSPTAAKATMV